MISDWELWACAAHVERQHGAGSVEFVASRVAALTQAGDEAGVRTWLAIAERLDRLADAGAACVSRH